MNHLKEQVKEIEELVYHQLMQYWSDIDTEVIHRSMYDAISTIELGFKDLPDKRYFDGESPRFSPYISAQWMILLYRFSHAIYKNGGGTTPKEADQVYYLNKIMHSIDWLYAIDLPKHFLCEHPLKSVLGRAQYGDYLFVYQGTTVGGNRSNGKLCYPILGDNVILFANSTVLGNSHIGNNVVISAETYIINSDVPDNCIVFGKSPDLVIKSKSEDKIKLYTQHIWGWS